MPLSEDELKEVRDHYFEPRNEWGISRVERVLEAAQIQPGERILDLGCSQGTFSYHAIKRGGQAFGLDRDHVTLNFGCKAARQIGNITLSPVCADALASPFSDNTFDLVINADFIEHTPDEVKESIFREMFRVLKPGGRGVVYTPNLARIEWELFGEKIKHAFGLRREKVPRWQDFVDPDHFGLTTPSRTRDLLKTAGFKTRDLYYEHHIPLISNLPVVGGLLKGRFPEQFAARFLIHVTKGRG